MGGTLYQGLVVHADGRFVADLEMGGGVVRALRMARSDAAEGAGWRDLTGKLVFPGPVVLCRSGMPLAGRGGCPATTVGVPVASLAAPASRPGNAEPDADAAYAADAVPIPLLRGLEPELEVLPEAVFGQGCAAFAVDDRILAEPGWDGDLVRVTGHCGATLVVLSDDARVMERSVGGLPLPLDGGRVVLAPSNAAGMRSALATALRSGEPGSGIAVAAPAHLLLAEPMAAAEWWPAVRSGTVRMVSIGAEEGAADRQLLARLWRAGVAAGHIALEELAALLCWQPARLLGLPAKGRLHPGCDADLAVLDPEALAPGRGDEGSQRGGEDAAAADMECCRAARAGAEVRAQRDAEDIADAGTEGSAAAGRHGAVVRVLRGGQDAAARPGRWIRATPVREPL